MKKRILSVFLSMALLLGTVGISGLLPVKAAVTESLLGEGDGDKLIAPADNVLKDVSCLRTDATGSVKDNSVILKVSDANWAQLFDGQALGVNSTSAGAVALGGRRLENQDDGAVDKGVDYSALYLAFDMKESYRFSRFFVAGYGDGTYGPQSVELYVGDEDVFSLIQSGTAVPQYQYNSRVVKEGLLVEFGEALKGRYFIVKLAGRLSSGVNYLTHLSELAAAGKPAREVTTESLLGEGDGDKLIAPADNVLKGVSCFRTDATGSVKDNSVILKVSDANWAQLFDGQVLGVNSTSAGAVALGGRRLENQDDGAVDKGVDYSALYLAFDMKESYRFSRFFVAGYGDGTYGPQSVELYVGDEDVFSLIESGTAAPQYRYNSRVVKEGLLVEFGEALTGRYFIVKLAGRLSNSINYLTHLSELAAVGEPVKADAVPPTESLLGEGDGDKLIAPADNVLKGVSCLRTDATGLVKDNSVILKVNDANWAQLFDGQALGVNSTSAGVIAMGGRALAYQADDAVDKGVDYSALYLAFDMKESYHFSRFFVAGNGDGAYGPQSVELYVGNEDVFSLIQSGTAVPQYQYNSRVVKEGLLVEFGEVLTGRYFIVKLAGRFSGGNSYLTHLSELAAAGKPVVNKTEHKKIVSVGDSITDGIHFPYNNHESWSTIQHENRYVVALEQLLDEWDSKCDYTIVNAGIGGSAVVGNTDIGTSDRASSWFDEAKDRGFIQETDILTIMLGTNDAPDNWSMRKLLYKAYYKRIVDAYRALSPDLKLYILTSPYSTSSRHTGTLENDIVPMQKELAKELGGILVDVYAASKKQVLEHGKESFIDQEDIYRGLEVHPSDEGQRLIAETCFDVFKNGPKPEEPEEPAVVNAQELGTGDGDKLIAPSENLLKNAAYIRTDKNGIGTCWVSDTVWSAMFDGQARGVNNAAATTAAIGGKKTPAESDSDYGADYTSIYIAFDMLVPYEFDSFLLAGQGDGTYGVENLALYIGNEDIKTFIQQNRYPQWTYSKKVTNGLLVDLKESGLSGQYLIVRLGTRSNSQYWQVWLSELAATGRIAAGNQSPMQKCVTGATVTEITENNLPQEDNMIVGMQPTEGIESAACILSAGNSISVTDGEFQNITQFVKIVRNAAGVIEYESRFGTAETDCDMSRVAYQTRAEENDVYKTDRSLRMTFDLGKIRRVDGFAVANSAEASITKERVEALGEEGALRQYNVNLRQHVGEFYVSETLEDLYNEENCVASWDYLQGGTISRKATLSPLAAKYKLDAAYNARYVGFKLYDNNGRIDNVDGRGWGTYSLVRLSELQVYGESNEGLSMGSREFKTSCSLGNVTVEIMPHNFFDADFMDRIDRVKIVEEALPAGIARNIENNWLTVVGDNTYALQLLDASGAVIPFDGKARRFMVTFPADKNKTLTMGVIEGGSIRRIFNSYTRPDGTISAGSMKYPSYAETQATNFSQATLYDLSAKLVFMQYNDLETINRLNNTFINPSVREFEGVGVAGLSTERTTSSAGSARAVTLAVICCGLLGAGAALWWCLRRRAKAQKGGVSK